MSQGKKLIKNTLIYGIGNFGSKVLSFLLLPLYSFYLNANEFGTYDLILATVSLIIPFITFQISDATYRWLLDANQDKKKQAIIISSGFFVITTFTVVFFGIFYIGSKFITYQYKGYFALVLLSFCYLPFFQQVVRGLGKNKIYAVAGIINTLLVLISNICFLIILKLGIESLFIASIISNFLVIVYLGVSVKVYRLITLFNIDIIETKKMLKYSWPLIPNSISWWLINVADKYIILYILNVEANGIYAVSTRFPSIIIVFNSIFLMAWQDYGITAQEDSESKAFFSKTFNKFIIFELTLVLVLISISQYLVKYFINIRFYDSYKYMPLLYIGVAYSAFSAYLGVGYQKAKLTNHIFTTTLIGGVVNICTSLFLLKHIGLYAPALGTFLSFLVVYIIRKYQTNRFFPIEVNNKKLIALTCLILIYSAIYINGIDKETLKISMIIIALAIFIILNINLVFDALSLAKNKVNKLRSS